MLFRHKKFKNFHPSPHCTLLSIIAHLRLQRWMPRQCIRRREQSVTTRYFRTVCHRIK